MLNSIALGMATLGLLIKTAKGFAQDTAENARSHAEILNARRASAFDISALQDQMYQSKQATDLQIFERQRQALRDQSRILTSTGEAGVGGNSLLRTLVNQEWDVSYDIGIHKANLENQAHMTSQHARAVLANRDSRVSTAQARLSNPWVNASLGIATGLPALYQTYKGIKEGNN